MGNYHSSKDSRSQSNEDENIPPRKVRVPLEAVPYRQNVVDTTSSSVVVAPAEVSDEGIDSYVPTVFKWVS